MPLKNKEENTQYQIEYQRTYYQNLPEEKKKLRRKAIYQNNRARKYRHKQLLIEYKGGCCEICGYNKCSDALVFHHLRDKVDDMGTMLSAGFSYNNLKIEADKCRLLCANCHAEIHAFQA